VKAGDHIVSARAIYPSSMHLFNTQLRPLGIETTYVDARDPKNVADAIEPNTKLVYLETPGNPTLSLCDLEAIGRIARAAGIVTICDNTFATPVNQLPLLAGIDVVVHSATKYFCGHGDAVGGLVAGRAAFIERCFTEPLRYYGGIMAPFNAYLMLRGTITLPLRVQRHNANALALAAWLEQHPAVIRVSYPGLPSSPARAREAQMPGGFGGMVCFDLKGRQAGARLMNTAKVPGSSATRGRSSPTFVHHAQRRLAKQAGRASPTACPLSVGLGR
jgi:cystathionine beta-lyase/cystathionine gamma-synthase